MQRQRRPNGLVLPDGSPLAVLCHDAFIEQQQAPARGAQAATSVPKAPYERLATNRASR